MQENSLVSVVMSAYNGESYLEESVLSVISQSYKNFEFIIIDDGSTDRTLQILNSFSDSRIKIISRENKGLTKSLNYAVSISSGELVARIDADDVFEVEKLAVQVDYFKRNPEVALCGVWAKFIDKKGNEVGVYKVPTTYSKIKHNILFHNPFIHPGVMFKRKVFDEMHGYNEKYRYAQDYELWGRIVPVYNVVNLPQYLLKYRKLNSGITKTHNIAVRWLGLKIRFAILFRFLFKLFI
ncbi:MAG: glycosyltransferase [Candidatus Magasanikbacteria bacterium]|nr:glycosyltransferase [Candidatus Magasanikbacteria bacterium]